MNDHIDGIRHLQAEDMDESLALSEFAFQYELSPEDKDNRKQFYRPEDTLGYFVNGKLAAKTTVLPLKMWIQGQKFAMGGINGVATWPEYRRYGMVGQLMQQSLNIMRERGQTISTLSPFASPFYRKYGWETFMERKRYEVTQSRLPRLESYKGSVNRVTPSEQLPILQKLYDEYAKQYNGMLHRDDRWWNYRVLWKLKETVAVYYNEDQEAKGYVMYQVKERKLSVKELIYVNEEARQALWKFLTNHDSMIESLTLLAPTDDSLVFELEEPRISQSVSAYYMARIVDVLSFLKLYPFAERGKDWSMTLQVRDTFAPWNDQLFRVVGTKRASVIEVQVMEKSDQINPDLICTIQALSLLFLSCRSPQWLQRTGRIHANDDIVYLLEQIIPLRTAFLLDGF